MTDTLLAAFKRIMSMSDFQTSWIQIAFYGSYFCLALPAALFIRKFSYKSGILLGLGFFITGALLFYPASQTMVYGHFLAALFILAGGLSVLETTANPYILAMGSEKTSVQRLNLAQAFNPIGSITGILLSKFFILNHLNIADATVRAGLSAHELRQIQEQELDAVMGPYVGVALLLAVVWITVAVIKMPAAASRCESLHLGATFRKLLSNSNYKWGVVAQFFYVGAQVGVWSFTIRYVMVELNLNESGAASYYLAALILFTISRFVFTGLLKFFRGSVLLIFSSIVAVNRFKIIGVFILSLFIFVSCSEDILNTNNPEQYTFDTYFKTPDEIVESANAMYVSFFQFWMGSYQWPEIWDVLGNESEATAGTLGSFHEIPIIQMMQYHHNETNQAIEFKWKMLYMMILRTNLTIEVSDRYLENNPPNDDVIRSRGEAYFLRGFAYFNLANSWGKVPIRTSFDQSENIDAPLANSAEEVWAVAESDLKEAQSVLKDVGTYGDADLGRATKGSATGLLGKLYLYNNKYGQAETEFAKLEGHYDLLTAEDYLWNFGETNENNIESVFEFQSTYVEGQATSAMFSSVEGGALPALNNMHPQLYTWNGWPNWKFPPLREKDFIYKDESGTDFIDPRGAETFYGGVAGDDTWCRRCDVNPNRPYDFAALGYYYKKKTNKEVKPRESGPTQSVAVSGNNIRIMRYADVLLMRAECALMQDDLAGAIDFINRVRKRFGIFEYTAGNYSKTELFEILKHERLMELMGEGHRFNDLKRWGILEETLNPEFQIIYGTQPVNASHYLFPIPQRELDTNFGI